jgi:class 3 adenylate cyclase
MVKKPAPRGTARATNDRVGTIIMTKRFTLLRRLSIKSQLLILLLAVGFSAIALVFVLIYRSGTSVREQTLFSLLTSVRTAKANRIQGYFSRIRAHLDTLGEDEMILGAMKEFGAAYQQLAAQPITPEMLTALTTLYTQDFLRQLAANSDGRPMLETYLPVAPQTQYLQFHYVVQRPDASAANTAPEAAADGSDYSRVHARLHAVLHRLVKTMHYHDLLLISPDGNIVYSTSKRPDFGTNLTAGPYSETNLARVFTAARRHKDRGHLEFVDYTLYPPSGNAPAAFFAVPLFDGAQLVGVLTLQLSIDEINLVMTGHRQWSLEGLGQSGEAYLVGEDFLLRSDSRFLLQDKGEYLKQITSQGLAPTTVARIDHFNTSVLLQSVQTVASRAALAGQTGTSLYTDYRGERVLGAFQPAGIPGVNWGLVTEMDYAEAMAPIAAFERQLALFVAGFVLIITLLSLWLASRFVRPISALVEGTRQVGEGREDVKVDDDARDEIGILARGFNAMVERLGHDKEEIRRKNRENEALLLNVLPAPIAQRLKNGEEHIADSIPNVTVLFADIIGFDEYSRSTNVAEVVGLLNEIVSAFDEAAERHGVERVKTIGYIYMAASGLSIPRVDHLHRMITCARELVEIIRRISQLHDLHLDLSIGINSGPAIAGIVGRQKFIYDLWGDTVNMAGRMQRASTAGGIKVTQAVKDALGDLHPFAQAGEFDVPGRGQQTIWELKAP